MFREKYNGVYSNGDISVILRYCRQSDLVDVLVDGLTYAILEHINDIDVLDDLAVCDWVDNTYYNDDYLSTVYTPPYINAKYFEATYKGG